MGGYGSLGALYGNKCEFVGEWSGIFKFCVKELKVMADTEDHCVLNNLLGCLWVVCSGQVHSLYGFTHWEYGRRVKGSWLTRDGKFL